MNVPMLRTEKMMRKRRSSTIATNVQSSEICNCIGKVTLLPHLKRFSSCKRPRVIHRKGQVLRDLRDFRNRQGLDQKQKTLLV